MELSHITKTKKRKVLAETFCRELLLGEKEWTGSIGKMASELMR